VHVLDASTEKMAKTIEKGAKTIAAAVMTKNIPMLLERGLMTDQEAKEALRRVLQ